MRAPHFDLPFRFGIGSFICAEQDSIEDIGNCVEVIVRTPVGFRDDAIDFGFPQLEFGVIPVISDSIVELVRAQEPRIDILITERPNLIDTLVDKIVVEVGGS